MPRILAILTDDMPQNLLSRFFRLELAPPRYLAMPTAGIDISATGVKVAVVAERLAGLELVSYGSEPFPEGAVTGGEVVDPAAVGAAVAALAKKHRIRAANIALSESRSYLFETRVEGSTHAERCTAVEQRLDEYVPLPPAEVAFDIVATGAEEGEGVVGIGYARRVVDAALATLDTARVETRAIESEAFSMARALLPIGSAETVLIVDIGRTTTKLIVVVAGTPRFTTTLDIGGHAFTLAIVKYFGVSEDEARALKAERGLVREGATDEYVASMLSTASAMRDEIAKRLEYWQSRASASAGRPPVTRVILAGGNASVRGLPEYFEAACRVPVVCGDVFANFAPHEAWLPPIEYQASLAYATAIGLALRNYA